MRRLANRTREALPVDSEAERFSLTFIDTRRAERLPLALPVTYSIDLPEGELNGSTTTCNVSGGGLQFLLTRMVSPQTFCRIRVQVPGQAAALAFRARVSWCRQVKTRGTTHYEIGVAFAVPEAEDQAAFSAYCHFIATQLIHRYLK